VHVADLGFLLRILRRKLESLRRQPAESVAGAGLSG